MFGGGGASSAVAAIGGALTGNPFALAAGGVGLLSSLFGLFGSEESPRDELVMQIMEDFRREMPNLSEPTFTESEVEGRVDKIKAGVDTSIDIAKTKTGVSLAEGLGAAGVPKGHPSSSMFVAENAPLDAKGVETKAGLDKYAMDFIAKLDSDSKQRILDAYRVLLAGSSQAPDQTSLQKGLISGLSALDLFTTGAGNLSSLFTDMNKEYIKP